MTAAALRRMLRRPAVWGPLTVLLLAGMLVLLLGPIAWWATPAKHLQGKDKADVRNATRQTLLAAVGGLVVLTGAAFTARTYYLTRRGQFTDRYTKAIGQLASDKLTERLGGIYALEHLMVESDQEHTTVIEVLAAFVRENRPLEPPTPPSTPIGPIGTASIHREQADGRQKIPTDVQAALTVLGRRPDRPELNQINLARTNLRGANLVGAQLEGAYLECAQLEGANLAFADLEGAWLVDAQLEGANLCRARLTGADLSGARLTGADLSGAWLEGADLSEARLKGADLSMAWILDTNVSKARLEGADLSKAWVGHTIKGPASGPPKRTAKAPPPSRA